jgi:hypothetical protein
LPVQISCTSAAIIAVRLQVLPAQDLSATQTPVRIGRPVMPE